MPLLGSKKTSSASGTGPSSAPPIAPPTTPAIAPNLPVNDYVVSQIKHSLEFLVRNQAITPYKSARIGALLDAGRNDEEVLTDAARFKPKPKGQEDEEDLGPVATWFRDTLSDTLPDLIVTAVGIIGIPLGSVQEEALSNLCEQAAPTIAKTLASRESRENLGKASLMAAKSSQTAMLKGAKATQNAFKKREKSTSTPNPSNHPTSFVPSAAPEQLEITVKETPDDNTRVYTTTIEPEPGKLLSVTHIYQSDHRILSKEEKTLLDANRKVPPPPPFTSRSSTASNSPQSPSVLSESGQEQFQRSPTTSISSSHAPPPPPRHPRANVMQPL